VFSTGWSPGTGYNARQSAADSLEGDFNEGFLVYEQREVFWNTTYSYWDTRNLRVQKTDFAKGESSASTALTYHGDCYAAAYNRFAFRNSDGNGDDQVWLWRNGAVTQITTGDLGAADDFLALGGTEASSVFVYNYHDSTRPGLYYQEGGVEYVLDPTPRNFDDLRMDGYRVAWNDFIDFRIRNAIAWRQPITSCLYETSRIAWDVGRASPQDHRVPEAQSVFA
jgi:hypothetical protein